MKLEVNIRHYDPISAPEIMRRLGRIEEALLLMNEKLNEGFDDMNVDFSELEAELAENNRVDRSAETLLNTIVQQLEEVSEANRTEVQAKLKEYVGQLRTSTHALAAAVQAKTPAETPTE